MDEYQRLGKEVNVSGMGEIGIAKSMDVYYYFTIFFKEMLTSPSKTLLKDKSIVRIF